MNELWNELKKIYMSFMNSRLKWSYEHIAQGSEIIIWQNFIDFLEHNIYRFVDNPLLYDLFIEEDDNDVSLNEDILNDIYDVYSYDFLSLYNQILRKKSKILQIDNYYEISLNSVGTQLIKSLYKYVKKNVKQAKSILDLDKIIEANLDKIVYPFNDDEEKRVFVNRASKFYEEQFKSYFVNQSIAQLPLRQNKIINKLVNYINNNLRKILLNLEINKDKSNMYESSWINSDGSLDSISIHELLYLKNYLINNKQALLERVSEKDVGDKEWNIICKKVIQKCNADNSILKKIYDFIQVKNFSLKMTRAKDLLTNDDEIGQETYIDYDITNDYVRTRPIIIIRDANSKKNYVFFGPLGTSHGNYVQNKLLADIAEKNITADNYYMGYGYLLGNIAFVDESGDELQVGYTFNDEVEILKNDPRIKKVYTTPGVRGSGGTIKRLAKLIAATY